MHLFVYGYKKIIIIIRTSNVKSKNMNPWFVVGFLDVLFFNLN